MLVERLVQTNVLNAILAIAVIAAVTSLAACAADGSKSPDDTAHYRANPVDAPSPKYVFGWQKFSPVDESWSVLMPNEPEPGRASLEQSNRLADPDAYLASYTPAVKATTHGYTCANENKRLSDPGNKEKFTVSCTTYAPESLKKWFSDGTKNLDDAVDHEVSSYQIAPGIPGARLIRKENVSCGSVPGREFEMHMGKGDSVVKIGRIFWVNDRLYELVYFGVGKPDLPACTKFLTSFELK